MFVYYNANPVLNIVGDCVIRAISVLTNQPWEIIHEDICYKSRLMYDMPSSNAVWGAFLKELGYVRGGIPDTCPACYTIRDFCKDNPDGKYLVATGSHVVAVIDGDYYDTWDSGDEVLAYYWRKGEVFLDYSVNTCCG